VSHIFDGLQYSTVLWAQPLFLATNYLFFPGGRLPAGEHAKNHRKTSEKRAESDGMTGAVSVVLGRAEPSTARATDHPAVGYGRPPPGIWIA
jgi:hypothetical protein